MGNSNELYTERVEKVTKLISLGCRTPKEIATSLNEEGFENYSCWIVNDIYSILKAAIRSGKVIRKKAFNGRVTYSIRY